MRAHETHVHHLMPCPVCARQLVDRYLVVPFDPLVWSPANPWSDSLLLPPELHHLEDSSSSAGYNLTSITRRFFLSHAAAVLLSIVSCVLVYTHERQRTEATIKAESLAAQVPESVSLIAQIHMVS